MFKYNSSTLFLIIFLLKSLLSFSQTITLTSPIIDSSFLEGDDYFSAILNNPIDFDDRRDLLWEERFDEPTINVNQGNWNGTYLERDAYIFPLFHGFVGTMNSGDFGIKKPIESTKYTLISYKNTISDRTNWTLNWSRNGTWPPLTPTNIQAIDGILTPNSVVRHLDGSSVYYLHDMSNNIEWTSQEVTGFRINPSFQALQGTNLSFDWIRVADPNTGTILKIEWNTSNVSQSPVNTTPQVNIYIDHDGSGYDGDFIGRVAYTDNSFDLNTAALPPGDYYFYLELKNNFGPDATLTTSNYSGKITINGRPRIEFINPSFTSGEDYATSVVQNAWDMNDDQDVLNDNLGIQNTDFINPVFDGVKFCAEAFNPEPGIKPHSDNRVELQIDENCPISTKKFRYLTYELEVDPTNFGNISDKVDNEGGWVTRWVWWNQGIQIDGSSTATNVTYEGRRSYHIDLHQPKNEILDNSDNFPSQTGWLGNEYIEKLRIDPLENNTPAIFCLYDIKLTAIPEPINTIFKIEFDTKDFEIESGSVDFYVDLDNSGFDGVYVGSKAIPQFGIVYDFSFSTSSFANGEYYIYAVSKDSFGNVSKIYSEVPIKINECEQTLFLNNNIVGDEYNSHYISASGNIIDSSFVELIGQECINIDGDFDISLGSIFKISIKDCN